jgi:hypothetical protein
MKTILTLTLLLFSTVFSVGAQVAAGNANEEVTPTYVIGEVAAVDSAKKQLKLKTTAAGEFTVLLNEKTKYLQLAPGETSLAKGEPIDLDKVSIGDRVMARGKVSVDEKIVPAGHVIVMKKEDISRKREREREEWRRRGIIGRITAINQQAKEVTLSVRSSDRERPVVVSVPDNIVVRRYAPDSVKFDDAKPSGFGELKLGDVVRARGNSSPDGKRFMSEEVVSGSFRMAGGKITSLSAAEGEIVINNLLTKQPLTIIVTPDSIMRRILPKYAVMLMESGGQANLGGTSAPGADKGPPNSGTRDGEKKDGNSQPPHAAGDNAQEIVDRLPKITFSDLKVGDVILISSTVGSKPSRATAIILAAGAETIINAAQRAQNQAARGGTNTSLGLSSGALDGAIGMP